MKEPFSPLFLTALLLGVPGCLTNGGVSESPVAEMGDTVLLDYVVTLEDGSVLDTTLPEVAENASILKVPYFNREREFRPTQLVLGFTPVIPGLLEALLGMREGEEKRVEIPPEKGYGSWKPDRLKAFSRKLVLPEIETFGAEDFYQRTGKLPKIGEVYTDPKIPWNLTVVDFDEDTVTVRHLPQVGRSYPIPDTSWNATVMERAGGRIRLEVQIRPNQWVFVAPQVGVVKEVEGDTFVVDFNHPAAGRTLFYTIRVLEVTKGGKEEAGR
jgi:FKBP-type peptidyl-prolyl cis-trans isomerase 2